MRTIKELLQIVLDNKDYFESGLCSWVSDVYWSTKLFNKDEFFKLKIYIRENRPSMFSSINTFIHRNSSFYWNPTDINPRIKWLKKHIKQNS